MKKKRNRAYSSESHSPHLCLKEAQQASSFDREVWMSTVPKLGKLYKVHKERPSVEKYDCSPVHTVK
jgi:hypothetical protein